MNILNNKKWIWQNKNFPDFLYEEVDLSKIYYKLGELRTFEKFLNKQNKEDLKVSSLYKEICNSYLLEGERLELVDLKNTISKVLNKKDNKETFHKKDVLLVKTFIDSKNNTKSLTKETLYFWSKNLLNEEISLKDNRYRTKDEEIEIVSAFKEEKVLYRAPFGNNIEELMRNFLLWINQENDKNKLYKLIIAPLYFLLIQPFKEENEKLSRLIFSYVLEKSSFFTSSYYEINSILYNKSLHYNKVIDDLCISKTLDINKYIEFYIEVLEDLLNENIHTLSKVCRQNNFWNKNSEKDLNIRQKKLINYYLKKEDKNIKVIFYMDLEKISRLMANRDLQDLVKKGILTNQGKGRGSFYTLIV